MLPPACLFSLPSQEKFKKDNGEKLMQILCGQEQAEAGPGVCSLLLAQSEVKPHCLLLVLANGTGMGHLCLGIEGGRGAEVRGGWVEIGRLSPRSTGTGKQDCTGFGRDCPVSSTRHQSIF